MILKTTNAAGDAGAEEVLAFAWLASQNTLAFTNAIGTGLIDSAEWDKVYIYSPGGPIIFTRDLATGQPVGGFDV